MQRSKKGAEAVDRSLGGVGEKQKKVAKKKGQREGERGERGRAREETEIVRLKG